MFGWGVLKGKVPESERFCIWPPPDVHIFHSDQSLPTTLFNLVGNVKYDSFRIFTAQDFFSSKTFGPINRKIEL